MYHPGPGCLLLDPTLGSSPWSGRPGSLDKSICALTRPRGRLGRSVGYLLEPVAAPGDGRGLCKLWGVEPGLLLLLLLMDVTGSPPRCEKVPGEGGRWLKAAPEPLGPAAGLGPDGFHLPHDPRHQ